MEPVLYNEIVSTAKSKYKNNGASYVFIAVLFSLFLYKLSFSFGGDGLSGNYSFILFPLVLILNRKSIKKPAGYFLAIIGIYMLILVVSIFYQIWFLEFIFRRLVSFVLFIAIFSYLFIEVDEKLVKAFKLALIAISVIESITTIKKYIDLGGSALGFAAKDAVGGQRFGFVYVLTLWILLFESWKFLFFKWFKIGFILIVFLGLLLTFSRSGLVAIFGSAFIYALVTLYALIKKKKVKALLKWLGVFLVAIGFLFILVLFFPELLLFFDERLFVFFAKGGIEKLDLGNQEGSEGFRVYIFQMIIHYIMSNPLTGSGYLGVWILFEDLSGSSHNQYTDILFRTGVIGFVIYIYLLFKIGRFLYQKALGLFWGFIGVLIYGLFHETFKESHGGFILTFLLGMLGSKPALSVSNQDIP